MTDTAIAVTDTRFRDVLITIADQVVASTGEGRNGDVFHAYREQVDFFESRAEIPYTVWLREQIEAALQSPADEKTRAMLDARTRFGETVGMTADIKLDRIRGVLDKVDPHAADDLDALLDFVAEIRKVAKDI
jgi:hypothetical protein